MIPKKIHYCWFGGKPLPPLAEKCLASWKKNCPDYEIICWDESNYDVTKNRYMREAYESQKWAFVSDYARKDIIYQHGGIYLDIDVEVIKPLDPLLSNKAFMGTEKDGEVSLGLGFGAEPKNEILKEMRDIYNEVSFINLDGSYNLTTCLTYENTVLRKYGITNINEEQFIEGIHIYPTDYFCPKAGYGTDINITSNTFSIHHYAASWVPLNRKIRGRVYYTIKRVAGDNVAESIRRIVGRKNKES